jgi:arabinose-5-phosphate isomerase
MAVHSDVVIDVGVEREACPMGLAPTTSTTATLAMGDALAVALINLRHFDKKDFKRFHPGGSLGERLSSRVRDIMTTEEHMPIVSVHCKIGEAIIEMDAKGIGATIVIDNNERLVGMLTDGDLRRALLSNKDIKSMKVDEVMSTSPKTIAADMTAAEALGLMEFYGITHLIILDSKQKVTGIVHLHDLLGREDFRINNGNAITKGTDN